MNFKPSWKTVCAFLKITDDKAATTELSLENIESLDAEMKRLKDENGTLVQAKKDIDEKLTASTGEVAQLKSSIETKDTEISTLKSSTEITQLKEQVQNLKNNAAHDSKGLTPEQEPEGEGEADLASFCAKSDGNYAAMTERLKKEGLI